MKHEQPYINHFNKEPVKFGEIEFKAGEIELTKRVTTDTETTFYFEVLVKSCLPKTLMGFPVVIDESAKAEVETPIVLGEYK